MDDDLVDAPQVQPLRREVVHERTRRHIGEHPPHLLAETRAGQLSALGQIEQPLVVMLLHRKTTGASHFESFN